mgnify:CR=1 FL=1
MGIAALAMTLATPCGATEQRAEAARPKEMALVQGSAGTPAREPAAKAAAKPSTVPIGAKPVSATPVMAYAPVADGGGLDRFLATLAPSQAAGEPVAPEDAAAVAEALRRIMDDPDAARRMALRARETIERAFDLAGNIARLMDRMDAARK